VPAPPWPNTTPGRADPGLPRPGHPGPDLLLERAGVSHATSLTATQAIPRIPATPNKDVQDR
jgi:hypothetical protein